MFDPIIHASIIFVYATIGLAVALWRLVKVGALAVAGGVVAWLYDAECERHAYQEERTPDEYNHSLNRQENQNGTCC